MEKVHYFVGWIEGPYGAKAGPIAERSKSSDLDRGWGDPGSNLGKGMFFSGCYNMYQSAD